MPSQLRRITLIATAAVLAAVAVVAFGPAAALTVPPADAQIGALTYPGAFHVHTTRSDGALDKRSVAAAAARAGLRFLVITDHGDGRREPDPPEYVNGVLCVDGVEISTNDGHYVAAGMSAAPYPLGGDAVAVAEDVHRLGGFGIAAHPVSQRAELAWSDWTVPITGLEWLNADSEWRDEGRARLTRSLLEYLWRPAGALAALLDRPVDALRLWDELTISRPVVALAGHDAHGGFGSETGGGRGRRLHLPSYEASFRTFAVRAILSEPPSGDAARDARALLGAIRGGAVFTSIDAVATPAALDFQATLGSETVRMGGTLPAGSGAASFRARATVPPGATISLKRNGQTVARRGGGAVDHTDSAPGAYRIEIDVDGAPGAPPVPWLVSNPVYLHALSGPRQAFTPASDGELTPVLSLRDAVWRAESDPGSAGEIRTSGEGVSLSYRLKPAPRASQFVALATDLPAVPPDVGTIVLDGSATHPMRVSVQLRFAGQQDGRWGSSIYLDSSERTVRLPIERLRSLGAARNRNEPVPPLGTATSLLFVVDLTNALPGSAGEFTLRTVSLGR